MKTTFSKKEETLKNQVKVENYHATYIFDLHFS